jgi:hypothetical protein
VVAAEPEPAAEVAVVAAVIAVVVVVVAVVATRTDAAIGVVVKRTMVRNSSRRWSTSTALQRW